MKPLRFQRGQLGGVRCLAAGDCFTAGVQALKLLQFPLRSCRTLSGQNQKLTGAAGWHDSTGNTRTSDWNYKSMLLKIQCTFTQETFLMQDSLMFGKSKEVRKESSSSTGNDQSVRFIYKKNPCFFPTSSPVIIKTPMLRLYRILQH